MKNVLCIIPARGGSKRLPLKNIKLLNEKPLIQYTIETAKKSGVFNKIIVSTDLEKIARVAKKNGVEVPFLRPKSISEDKTLSIEVIKHAVNFLKHEQNYNPDIICLLQPTSPLRQKNIIKKAYQLLLKSNASSVIEISKIKTQLEGMFTVKRNYLKKIIVKQKLCDYYYPTGSIYIFWHKTLQKYNSIYGPKIKYIINRQEEFVDIDTKFDFFIAEMIIKNWNSFNKK